MMNKYGLQRYYCLRGTGLTEVHHKQMVQSIGTWSTGIEMSDAVRQEHGHRYNHRISERRRASFPNIGHFDTWRVDALQLLVEHNHNVLVYPNWSNTADFIDTEETFGTVPLQCNLLTSGVQQLTIDQNVLSRLSREQKYLAQQQNVPLPFTPIVSKEEKTKFKQMVLEIPRIVNDMDNWAMRWLEHVDGKTIFPKLPVYLRTYHEKFLLNSRIREAVNGIEDKISLLRRLNGRLQPPPDNEATTEEDNAIEACEYIEEHPVQQQMQQHTQALQATWMPPADLPLLPLPPVRQPHGVVQLVGGVQVGIAAAATSSGTRILPKKRGQRSRDKQKRSVRQCKQCVLNGGPNSTVCRGRAPKIGKEGCQFFNADGTSLS
jgi:hypothetical protein